MSRKHALTIPDTPTITVAQYREIVPMGENQTYSALAKGDIPAVRMGRVWHILTAPLKKKFGIVE